MFHMYGWANTEVFRSGVYTKDPDHDPTPPPVKKNKGGKKHKK